MTPNDLTDLLAKAHTAARAGQVAEGRALIAEAEGAGFGGDDLCTAFGMLHYMTGDAVSAERWLRKISKHSHESLICLSAAASACGDNKTAALAHSAALELPAERVQCIEDVIGGPSLEQIQLPARAHRGWGPQMQALARGEFETAAREMLKVCATIPPYGPGALVVKLRSGKKLPLWRGQPGRRLAVIFSDGHGDVFCFGRYLQAIAATAEDVVVIASAPVLPLLARDLRGIRLARLDDCSDDLERANAYVNPWLLPHQSGQGYGAPLWLTAAPAERAEGLHVGVVWNGSLWNQWDALRSMRIEQLQPLLDLPGVTWHSLQVGPKAAECPAAVVDHSRDIRDFLDTAHIIAGLDLVISVDTAVANLCGALGLPVWVLVERENDFRWGVAGERTPWFPSAKVFRQRAGGWGPVVEAVRAALDMLYGHAVAYPNECQGRKAHPHEAQA